MLQTSKLISELFNKQGHVLKITIGEKIFLNEGKGKAFDPLLLKNLRSKLYALKNQLHN